MTLTVMEKPTTKWSVVKWFKDDKTVIDYGEFVSMDTLAKAAVQSPARPVPVEAMPKVVEQTLDAQFMRALEQVVREVGESHRCQPRPGGSAVGQYRYVHQGQGDCIVGKALVKMGVSVGALSMYEGNGAGQVVRGVFGTRPETEVTRTVHLATAAQTVNDSRQPWGAALALARAVELTL